MGFVVVRQSVVDEWRHIVSCGLRKGSKAVFFCVYWEGDFEGVFAVVCSHLGATDILRGVKRCYV
jgi:hypothetical protein